MRNIAKIILLIACAFIAFACKDNDDPISITPSPGNDLIFSEGVSFTSVDKSKKVSFTTNKEWEITLAETRNGTSWCRVEPMKGGPGEANITIEVDDNEGYDDRSIALTINVGGTIKTIPISQKQKDALTVTSDRFDVEPGGKTIAIEVKANVSYEVNIPEDCKSWVKQVTNNARGLTTQTVNLKIEASEEYEKRECEVTITDGNLTEIINIYQHGSAIILLNENEKAVSDAGETIRVDLTYNCEYEIKMPDVDWIALSAPRAVSSHTLFYTITANPDYDNREAKIIFFDKKNKANADTLTIKQAAKGAIILSKKEFEFNQRDSIFNVLVNTNVELNVTIPDTCNWIKRIVSRALETRKLEFSVEANSNLGMRRGVILVQNEAGNLSDTIKVIQRGTSSEVTLEKYEINAGVNGGEFKIKINAHVPVSLEPWEDSPSDNLEEENYYKDLFICKNKGDVLFTKSITNNYLIIKIEPTTFAVVNPSSITVYGKYDKQKAIIKIAQSPDTSKPLEYELTENGRAAFSGLFNLMQNALGYLQTIEAYYTQSWQPEATGYPWNEYYAHTITSLTSPLNEAFGACYVPFRHIKLIEENLEEENNGLGAGLNFIESILYYEMITLWENVPYMTHAATYPFDEYPQMPRKELVETLMLKLLNCIDVFGQVKTNPTTDINSAIFPSRNGPLVMLARLSMMNAKWNEARHYLEQVVASNQYSLEASRAAALTKNSNELIYSFLSGNDLYTRVIEKNETLPGITYTEVYLTLAELCGLVGDNAKATDYLNTVIKAKGYNISVTSGNYRSVLTDLWKSELKGTGTYFEYLKRNNLAEIELNIESFRKILPFPRQEIDANPNLVQNPGY